jgi:hypothetical protein
MLKVLSFYDLDTSIQRFFSVVCKLAQTDRNQITDSDNVESSCPVKLALLTEIFQVFKLCSTARVSIILVLMCYTFFIL